MAVLGTLGGIFQTMLQGIRSVGSTFAALPFRIHFVLFWLLALLFLLFNAEAFYGQNAGRQTTILLMYSCSLAFFFSQTRMRNPLIGMSTAEFMLTFLLWGAIGAFAFKVFAPFTPTEQPLLSKEAIGIVLTHALVVAIGEELLFRFAVPSLIPGPPMAAQTLSAAAFAAMHWSAYGGSIPNMIFAFALGLFFGAITVKVRNGLVVAMALHAVFNLTVLGFV